MEKTDNSYIAIDLETTGFSPVENKIIEIGAVKVENGKALCTGAPVIFRSPEIE